jgi:hypothetical protein
MRAQIRARSKIYLEELGRVFTGQYLSSVRQDLSCTIARVTIWAGKWKRGLLSHGVWMIGHSLPPEAPESKSYDNPAPNTVSVRSIVLPQFL